MLLYAITQRSLFAEDESASQQALLAQACRLAVGGVHYLQIREKDMPPAALRSLAASIVEAVRPEGSQMKILLNGSPSIAAEAGCHGVHLPGAAGHHDALAARQRFRKEGLSCIISGACHSIEDIRTRRDYADILLFGPVFEKITSQGVIPGVGLAALSQAAKFAGAIPVLALGGVTAQNAAKCIQAGAAGIAAIRLFAHEGWKPLMQT